MRGAPSPLHRSGRSNAAAGVTPGGAPKQARPKGGSPAAFDGRAPSTFVAFLDVASAYDTVWWDGLWARLWDVGIRGTLLRILQDWYAGNVSRIVLGGDDATAWFPIHQGVKQGAVLSPLLYAIFVDPLIREVEASGRGLVVDGIFVGAILYADDMCIMAESSDDLCALLKLVERYSLRWRFHFKPSKCEVLTVNAPPRPDGTPPPWCLYGCPLEETESYRYLGVDIQQDGYWDQVCLRMRTNGFAAAYRWRRAGLDAGGVSVETGAQLYSTYVAPSLSYGAEVWDAGPPSRPSCQGLRAVQGFVGDAVLGLPYNTSRLAAFSELGWLPFEARQDELRLRFFRRLELMPSTRPARRLYELRRRDAEQHSHFRTIAGRGRKPFCVLARDACERHGLLDYWTRATPVPDSGDEGTEEWKTLVRERVAQQAWWRLAREMRKLSSFDSYRPIVGADECGTAPDATAPRASFAFRLRAVLKGRRLSARQRASVRTYAQLRLGANSLEMSAARRVPVLNGQRTQRTERFCLLCADGLTIGTEAHFLVACPSLAPLRRKMFAAIRQAFRGGHAGASVWDYLLPRLDDTGRAELLLGRSIFPLSTMPPASTGHLSDEMMATIARVVTPLAHSMMCLRARLLRARDDDSVRLQSATPPSGAAPLPPTPAPPSSGASGSGAGPDAPDRLVPGALSTDRDTLRTRSGQYREEPALIRAGHTVSAPSSSHSRDSFELAHPTFVPPASVCTPGPSASPGSVTERAVPSGVALVASPSAHGRGVSPGPWAGPRDGAAPGVSGDW